MVWVVPRENEMKGNAVDSFWEKKEIKWAKQTKLLV